MRVLLVGLLAAIGLMAGGCGDDEPAGGGGGGGDPVKIGINEPLSGPGAAVGQAKLDGAQARVDQINKEGGILGRQVELVVKDNRGDQTEALTVTRDLIDREQVHALIGNGTSPATLSALPAMLKSGIPTISEAASEEIVAPPEEKKNIFKVTPIGTTSAQVIVKALKERGIGKIGALSVNDPYGADGLAGYQALEESGDIEITGSEVFEATDSDVTPQLRGLLRSGPEAIVVVAIPPGVAAVRRNAVEQVGTDIPMYFDPGAAGQAMLDLAGPAADGAFVASPRTLVWDQVDSSFPQYEQLQAFGKAYDGDDRYFAGLTWDAVGMLKAAMEKAGSTDKAAVVGALNGMSQYTGASGELSLSEDQHTAMDADDMTVLTVKDGKWALTND
jgi:branched-chain amino acid transport system substrate-binding protein